MELHEYPRPANDTGIGIHWAPGYAAAVGMAKLREVWIPELRALGVKWVKIYNHDGALDFAELLLAEGFMPIVRLYRPVPNPGRLSLREIVFVDSFVRVGVRYFEFNSEPDRDSEWKGGRVPSNGLELVAEDSIVNMEAILERGGMPAVPALSVGSTWDLVGKIVALGRKDLFDGPVWQAIHNYARNRPIDYPFDIGNQEGAAFTERFYRTVADEPWDENAWRGRTLAEVNRLRMDRCAPGASLRDDHAGWLAYQHYDALNRHHLGRSLPILATESGYVVGDDSDARYPAATPNLHMAQTLELCRTLMGTSTRFPGAPDYFFCAAFSVIANQQLGGSSAWWEKFAWYSSRWPGGTLPIVRALRAEPKSVRKWQGAQVGDPLLTLRGAVLNRRAGAPERPTLVLERDGIQVASTLVDPNNRYLLTELAPGDYTLHVEGYPLRQPVRLSADQPELVVNLDVGKPAEVISRSLVEGRVRGGAGASLRLLRAGDGEEYVTTTREDGAFRFVDLPPGAYSLQVMPAGSRVENLTLDGRNQVELEMSAHGWGHVIETADPTPGMGAIRVRVREYAGAVVQIYGASGAIAPVITGSTPGLPGDMCQVEGLENGLYIVTVTNILDDEAQPVELEARVTVDRRRVPLVDFSFNNAAQPPVTAQSSVTGRVIGPLESMQTPRVRLLDEAANAAEQPVQADGSFKFERLPPGTYALEVVGHEASGQRQDIALDGVNQVAVDLLLPMQKRSAGPLAQSGGGVILGHVPGAAGRLARLVDAVGNEQRADVGLDDTVRFERLLPGEYTLTVEGGYEQGDLVVNGATGHEVLFAPLASSWEVQVTRGESMPGYSVVRVEVEGLKDVPVFIWKEQWEGMMKRTGSRPEGDALQGGVELGPCAVEFSPLGPGVYMIEPEGLGVWTDVELTGLEAKWITFRPRSAPTQANQVLPLKVDAGPTLRQEAAARRTRHYVYIGDVQLTGSELSAVLSYAAAERAVAGADFAEALLSDVVTLVGETPNTGELRNQLSARGIAVQGYTPAQAA
jgi:hypothetical protein